jgi:molecular chaperone GrpE (heat shock protein)
MDLNKLADVGTVREVIAEWRDRFAELLKRVARTASDARRVLEHEDADARNLRDALEALRGQLVEALRAEEAELFGRVGELVDPRRHQILETREPESDPCTILEVESEGLTWEGKVIDKAAVIASRRPSGTAP